MPSSTKWRIYISAPVDAIVCRLKEITMSDTAGGADICTGGTATASTGTASSAFDDDAGTYWATTFWCSYPQWVQYEFASAVDIVQYSLRSQDGYGPKDFALQYWDGDSWETTDSQTGQITWTAGECRTFPLTDGMRWRLRITDQHYGPWCEIGEISLRIVSEGANVCVDSFRCSATTSGNGAAGNVLDGNNATRWGSDTWSVGHQWRYWFTESKTIVEYVLTATSDTGARMPKSWMLERWDGSTWVAYAKETNVAAWSNNESRTYSVGDDPIPNQSIVTQALEDVASSSDAVIHISHLSADVATKVILYVPPMVTQIVSDLGSQSASSARVSQLSVDVAYRYVPDPCATPVPGEDLTARGIGPLIFTTWDVYGIQD